MTKRRYCFTHWNGGFWEAGMLPRGEVRAWDRSYESSQKKPRQVWNLRQITRLFVKPACGESYFRHNVMPSLLSGIWGPFACFWQINIQAGLEYLFAQGNVKGMLGILALDVRVLNWNYIIDEVIRRSQYELEHQRKVYIKISLLNQCST